MRSIIVFFCLLLLVGCTVSQEKNAVVIGGAFALTGDANVWGTEEQRAASLAIEEANARGTLKFTLITEDTHSTQAGSLTAAQKLMTVDTVQAIVGPTWGDSFGSIVAPIGEENHVVQITPSGALDVAEKESEYPYYFSTFYPITSEIDAHMQFLAKRGYSRVAYVYDEDPFDATFVTLYQDEAAKRALSSVGEFGVPVGTMDFKSVLVKVKAANPDVVVLEIMNVAQMGLFVKQAKDLGLAVPVVSSAGAQTTALLDTYSSYVDHSFFFSTPVLASDAQIAFADRYAARYGEKPATAVASTAYDATRLIIAAVESGAVSGEDIRAFIATQQLPGTAVQSLTFTEKGSVAAASFVIMTVHENAFIPAQ